MSGQDLRRVRQLLEIQPASVGGFSRRQFTRFAAFGAAMLATPGAFAEELSKTPQMAEGPFYPDHLPLDTDNDLLIVNNEISPAVGEITHLSGRVLDVSGAPIRSAFVEIWQCDSNGAYLHSGSSNRSKYDQQFQGYGRFLTGRSGEYYFRTIKPVPYPGRTPHIHIAVSMNGKRMMTTQLLIKGHPQNETDGLFRRIKDPEQRALLVTDFQPIAESKIGELAADFDVVLGRTPDEEAPGIKGGISQPLSRG